jgi:hypothetical protein
MTEQQQEATDTEDEPEADIDESDHADGADIFAEIDPDSDLDDEQQDAEEESTTEEESNQDESTKQPADPLSMADSMAGEGRVQIGDVYCNGVGLAAAAAVGSFGDEDDPRDRKQLMDEYSSLARDLELDQYVNEALAAHGGPDDLPPAHAAVMMTVVLAASIAVSEPAAASNLADSIKTNT